jgi:hypothetical protein
VKPAIVKQRLRLASVSPKLQEVYAEDGMTLEHNSWLSRSRPITLARIKSGRASADPVKTSRVSAQGVRTRLDRADGSARAVGLDMIQAGWRPTVDNYFGRVTKPRILVDLAASPAAQEGGAERVPAFLAEEDRDSASDDDRPQLDTLRHRMTP